MSRWFGFDLRGRRDLFARPRLVEGAADLSNCSRLRPGRTWRARALDEHCNGDMSFAVGQRDDAGVVVATIECTGLVCHRGGFGKQSLQAALTGLRLLHQVHQQIRLWLQKAGAAVNDGQKVNHGIGRGGVARVAEKPSQTFSSLRRSEGIELSASHLQRPKLRWKGGCGARFIEHHLHHRAIDSNTGYSKTPHPLRHRWGTASELENRVTGCVVTFDKHQSQEITRRQCDGAVMHEARQDTVSRTEIHGCDSDRLIQGGAPQVYPVEKLKGDRDFVHTGHRKRLGPANGYFLRRFDMIRGHTDDAIRSLGDTF